MLGVDERPRVHHFSPGDACGCLRGDWRKSAAIADLLQKSRAIAKTRAIRLWIIGLDIMLLQPTGSPIFVGSWLPDEDFPIHPVGSKPKKVLVCPEGCAPPVIAGHHYIFKIADGWKSPQLWSEIVAYQLGCIAGIPVPPAFLAVDEVTGQCGVLIEFFYGPAIEAQPSRFIHAIEYIRPSRIADGEPPHFLRTNFGICRALQIPDYLGWWGRTLAFDALIGNTDRHTENWGFLIRPNAENPFQLALAPAYDNGTSLGFQQAEAGISFLLQHPDNLMRYIDRGSHHCRVSPRYAHEGNHIRLCGILAKVMPEAGVAMRNVIRFDEQQFRSVVSRNVCDGVAVPLSQARADLMIALVLARRERLRAELGG